MSEKLKYQLRNLIIPEHVYKDNRLNWTSARVYAFIYSYTNPFFFSNEHLAEMFDVHEQTISTAMKSLEELGMVRLTYKIKADGGKVRLSEVTHSERAKSLIRKDEKRAPTERSHSDKDIKDNNIKEEGAYSNLLPKRKEDRVQKIGWGNRQPSGNRPLKEYPKKGGYADGRNVF